MKEVNRELELAKGVIKLQKALKLYGRHMDLCDKVWSMNKKPCSCGLAGLIDMEIVAKEENTENTKGENLKQLLYRTDKVVITIRDDSGRFSITLEDNGNFLHEIISDDLNFYHSFMNALDSLSLAHIDKSWSIK